MRWIFLAIEEMGSPYLMCIRSFYVDVFLSSYVRTRRWRKNDMDSIYSLNSSVQTLWQSEAPSVAPYEKHLINLNLIQASAVCDARHHIHIVYTLLDNSSITQNSHSAFTCTHNFLLCYTTGTLCCDVWVMPILTKRTFAKIVHIYNNGRMRRDRSVVKLLSWCHTILTLLPQHKDILSFIFLFSILFFSIFRCLSLCEILFFVFVT